MPIKTIMYNYIVLFQRAAYRLAYVIIFNSRITKIFFTLFYNIAHIENKR